MTHSLEETLGTEAEISVWIEESLIEIREFDALTTKDEIANAVIILLDGETIQTSEKKLILSDSSAYQPIFLLDTVGKTLKKILPNRL